MKIINRKYKRSYDTFAGIYACGYCGDDIELDDTDTDSFWWGTVKKDSCSNRYYVWCPNCQHQIKVDKWIRHIDHDEVEKDWSHR